MSRKILLAVFLVSLGVLMFEISLLRIFSVLMRYHYVFLIVSMSMCGLGAGGILAFHMKRKLKDTDNPYRAMFFLTVLAGITMPLSIMLLFKTPLRDFFIQYTAISIIPFIPFLFAGAFFSYVFEAFGRLSGKIYSADLAGAAAGCILVLVVLRFFGGINTVFITGAIVLIATLIIAETIKTKIASVLFLCAAVACVFVNRDNLFFSIPFVRDSTSEIAKPLFTLTQNSDSSASIVYTEWNAFARTDVVQFPRIPGIKYIYTDGDVPTTMHYFDGDFDSIEYIKNTVFYLPFADLKNPKVLSIGPGGGIDILASILGGSKDITGVEVNPSMFSIMEKYASFNGGLYSHPYVRVFLDDGRSFVKRTTEKYDLIFLALTQSATSPTTGGVLTEGYIHTKEAFKDYLDRLNDDGMIVFITQNEFLLLRGFATFLSILNQPHKSGLTNLMVFTVPESQFETSPYRYILIAGRNGFSEQRKVKIKDMAEKIGIAPVFVPSFVAKPPFNKFGDYIDLHGFIAEINSQLESPVNLFPVSDDSPFFLDLSFGVPLQFKKLLFLVFFFALGIAGFILLRDLKENSDKKFLILTVFITYFAIIGVAYMIVEIALIQEFILFLGHPTFAVSVVLFSLLAGSGTGSFISQ